MIVPSAEAQVPAIHVPLMDQAEAYAKASKAGNTVKAYSSDWQSFCSFCQGEGVSPLPAAPQTVAAWVASMAGSMAAATIRRRLASVSQAHKLAGLDSPTSSEAVKSTFKGVLRVHGSQQRKAAPVRAKNLRRLVADAPETAKDARDLALILLGFFGAFRRSELVALDVEDLAFTEEGVTVNIRRSKTDQQGKGRTIGVPAAPGSAGCPVKALRAHLEASGQTSGPLFRRSNRWGQAGERLAAESVADILKAKAEGMGLDPAQVSGHSLRRGFVTEAYASGAETPEIQAVSGHKSIQVLAGYYQEANVFKNASARIRL